MRLTDAVITRRSFLKAAAGLWLVPARAVAAVGAQIKSDDLALFRDELIKLVNMERAMAGAPALAPDELACQVAARHALDMATGKFLSHWGRDGRKAYHRYALAGGYHATAENVSSADSLETMDPKYLIEVIVHMHMRMHAEVPPFDGHRQTILAQRYTHVGFGIAVADRSMRLAELYVAKYVQLDPYPIEAKLSDKVQLRGRLLNPRHRFRYAEIFYEPLPVPPEIDWLRVGRSYGLPDDYIKLRPKALSGTLYADGLEGTIELDKARFRIPVTFFKQVPGIYSVVIWISEKESDAGFSAATICIQVA
jgi:uncharacterized protein YkwD